MTRSAYTVEWLDEYGQVYETIDDLISQEVTQFRRDAKYCHLCIRVTNKANGKKTVYNYLDSALYAER